MRENWVPIIGTVAPIIGIILVLIFVAVRLRKKEWPAYAKITWGEKVDPEQAHELFAELCKRQGWKEPKSSDSQSVLPFKSETSDATTIRLRFNWNYLDTIKGFVAENLKGDRATVIEGCTTHVGTFEET